MSRHINPYSARINGFKQMTPNGWLYSGDLNLFNHGGRFFQNQIVDGSSYAIEVTGASDTEDGKAIVSLLYQTFPRNYRRVVTDYGVYWEVSLDLKQYRQSFACSDTRRILANIRAYHVGNTRPLRHLVIREALLAYGGCHDTAERVTVTSETAMWRAVRQYADQA